MKDLSILIEKVNLVPMELELSRLISPPNASHKSFELVRPMPTPELNRSKSFPLVKFSILSLKTTNSDF